MELAFSPICLENKEVFSTLLHAYYRNGEDRDTPEEEINAFIALLFSMVEEHQIFGSIAYQKSMPVGFVLFTKDTADGAFSELPGWGTILEIGVHPNFHRQGFGTQLVAFAENALSGMNVCGLYICAYPPAHAFWNACNYYDSGKIAANKLPIFYKQTS